jgi:hypothetical protein
LTSSITHAAPIIICALDGNGGGNLYLRGNSVSFAIEEIKTIVVSRGKAHRIYTNTGGQIGVHSSNINHQLVVEVHPHIVITLKLEELTSLVSKTSVNLHAEGKIVNLTILTKQN